jgi:hypothetical protein
LCEPLHTIEITQVAVSPGAKPFKTSEFGISS